MNRKKLFYLSNVFFPLALGLSIYVFLYKNTFLNSFFPFTINIQSDFFVYIFIKSWLCDMLWSYALTFSLFIVLFSFKNRLLISAIISSILGIICEIFQLANVFSGTFDILDIFFEHIAIALAICVIKRRVLNEKSFINNA